MIIIM